MKFCNRCMEQLEKEEICPHCGYDFQQTQNIPHALRPGTILSGKYLIGNVLGQGGFGITYIGFDLALQVKIAVKEYFVTGNASRIGSKGPEVFWTADPGNMSHFLTEARRMALLEQMPEIAHVRDVFYDNHTAYIIMEYVEGKELKKHLQQNGTMPFAKTVELMLPVIEALGRVHEKEIVHRDISPDNLMMEPDGTLRVLDLGAAGDLSRNDGQASQMIARHGFSPYEQYIETGKIGPWTDVYAVCATIYYCCTGKVIPDAYARVDQKMKTKDSRIQMADCIPTAGAEVLQRGLAMDVPNRIPNMPELARQLREALSQGDKPVSDKEQVKKKKGSFGWKIGLLIAAVLALVIGGCVFFLPGISRKPTMSAPSEATEAAESPTEAVKEKAETLELLREMTLTGVEKGHQEVITILSGPAPEEIQWSSSDPKVAKISDSGMVTAVDFGSARITAEYAGQSVTCTVTVTLKENVTCTYEPNTTGLTITGFEGELPTNVILPTKVKGEYITQIGEGAFRDCANLVSIRIPETVTRIEKYAFSDCASLGNVTLPEGLRTIEDDAFYGCSGLSEVVIPDSVTQMGKNVFAYCTGLTSVRLPKSLTVIEQWAFCGCVKLSEVTISGNVALIREGAFRYCTGLTNVVFPDSVAEIGESAFQDCTNLATVTLGNGVMVIAELAFAGCPALTEIVMPESISLIQQYAFSGCIGLSKVTFPNRKVTIRTEAFAGCSSLEEVTISNSCDLGYGAFPNLCTIKFF